MTDRKLALADEPADGRLREAEDGAELCDGEEIHAHVVPADFPGAVPPGARVWGKKWGSTPAYRSSRANTRLLAKQVL